jgi:hypothetical protein
VAEDNQYYTSQEGALFDKDLTELIQYPCGKQKKEYEIPYTVTSLGSTAFYDCTSLKILICDAVAPPVVKSVFCFSTSMYADCQLLVPKESLEDYKNDEIWSNFANISAISDYDAITLPNASICDTSAIIYTLDGVCISGSVSSLKPGIYVIRQGGKVRKIMVR